MLWKKRSRNKKCLVFAALCMMALMAVGCGNETVEKSDITGEQADDKTVIFDEKESVDAETIAELLSDIYAETANDNTLGSLETIRCMIERLNEHGYTAAHMDNQIDIAGSERALAFCKAVEEKETAHMAMIVFTRAGFHMYDLKTEDGHVNVARQCYQYDQSGQPQKKSETRYLADLWQYTEEGYLFFTGNYFSDENYVLTLSDATEYAALRVLPLPETCRELNRKYILPVGYQRNNIFLTDWGEEDFGTLDFYDIFDRFYPILNGQPHPYAASGTAGAEPEYEIPETTFENVAMAHFRIDQEILRSKTLYLAGNAVYKYKPRGFYEAEYPEIPVPEVVDYTENGDGTVTLFVNAVYGKESTAKAFSHKTVIRPLDEGGFQYVSNEVILPEEGYDMWWHCDRLTAEEHCLLTEAEKAELETAVLTAARQAGEVYQDIELAGESAFGSNIRGFTEEQRREAVSLPACDSVGG